METLFQSLVTFLSADVDRRGEAHFTCPSCGHESSPKRPHCSFNEHGWHCFPCGAGGGIRQLADLVKLPEYQRVAETRVNHPKPKQTWSWFTRADEIISGFESHPLRFELWGNHKNTSIETVKRHRFGVGVLPASKCRHDRLIVPIFVGSECVGLRGRQLSCDCGKWLTSGGTVLKNLPLYGDDALTANCVVWIVENCVDARNIYARTGFTGCAIYSVSYWREEWIETLRAAHPRTIVIALDNDLVGNGGAQRRSEFFEMWKSKHPTGGIPESAGIRIVNTLLQAGLPAILYDWKRSEHKADIGGLI